MMQLRSPYGVLNLQKAFKRKFREVADKCYLKGGEGCRILAGLPELVTVPGEHATNATSWVDTKWMHSIQVQRRIQINAVQKNQSCVGRTQSPKGELVQKADMYRVRCVTSCKNLTMKRYRRKWVCWGCQ